MKGDSYLIVYFSVKTSHNDTGMCFLSPQVERPSACMRNLVFLGRHNLKKTGPETTYKNPVLPDKPRQKDMKLCAQGTCLKPNIRGTPVPARRAHLCRDAHAQDCPAAAGFGSWGVF